MNINKLNLRIVYNDFQHNVRNLDFFLEKRLIVISYSGNIYLTDPCKILLNEHSEWEKGVFIKGKIETKVGFYEGFYVNGFNYSKNETYKKYLRVELNK